MQCSSPIRLPGRREARREERRDAILDVAACSFMENGYAGTTMSGIACVLGGSKGTLWNYFPSKDVLFDAVLDRATRLFREELEGAMGEAEGIEATLRKLCESFIAKMSSPEAVALYRLVMGEARRFPEIGSIFYERGPQRTLELIAGILKGMMDSGVLRPAHPFTTAQYLLGLCTARSHQKLLTGVYQSLDPAEVIEQAADAVEVFLRAFGPPVPAPGGLATSGPRS